MYPYDDDGNQNGASRNNYTTGSSYQWNNPQQRMQWDGSTYRSYGSQSGSYNSSSSEPESPKGPRKRTGTRILCGVLACLMVSTGPIGGFVALVNNGYVTLSGSAASSSILSSQASVSSSILTTPTTTTKAGVLTAQGVAKRVIPSVVCIQNYQAS